jgi:polar amino acid transport system substrate-binding protein
MSFRSRVVATAGAILLVAACGTGPAASPTGSPAASPTASPAATATPTQSPAASPSPTAGAQVPAVVCVGEATTYLDWLTGDLQPDLPDPISQPADPADDLLQIVRDRGVLRISTDADYAPQSELQPDGTFEGFDIDVGTEVAERLGVTVEFQHQDWDLITAGSWAGRWDVSVGSMTITTPRKDILSFTQPYYYTPAGLAIASSTGINSVDELPFELPEGVEATTLPTDANCAEAIRAGRTEFLLWISALPTIDNAIDQGIPLTIIGDPIFTEGLAIAMDKSGPPHAGLLYEIDRIIGEMHADGTLRDLSMKWYEEDLTQDPAGN